MYNKTKECVAFFGGKVLLPCLSVKRVKLLHALSSESFLCVDSLCPHCLVVDWGGGGGGVACSFYAVFQPFLCQPDIVLIFVVRRSKTA